MSKGFPERGPLDLPGLAKETLELWERENTFQASIDSRPADNTYVFYEGPPSANGMPGIHHVMGRTIKDIFCRYATLKGIMSVKNKTVDSFNGNIVELP